MSFKEVTALRKAGDLDAALQMARADYSVLVNDYSASALFWTLKAVCDRCVYEGNLAGAQSIFTEMESVFQNMNDAEGIAQRSLKSLEAKVVPVFSDIARALADAKAGNTKPAYDYILSLNTEGFPEKVMDNIAWIVFYHLRKSVSTISTEEFEAITTNYFSLEIPRPSMVHSQILNQAIKFSGIQQQFPLLQFIGRWGVKNFSDEDRKTDENFGGGLSLQDRAIRRCFLDRSVTLQQVTEVFEGCPGADTDTIAALLSRSYWSMLYKDSAETNDMRKFFADADEYVARISGTTVRNEYHSKILDSVLWKVEGNRVAWFREFFEKWGLGASFLPDDWKDSSKDGKTIHATAEKALSKYDDALKAQQDVASNPAYNALLQEACEKLSNNENVARRLALINFTNGNTDEAIRIICNLIKTHAGKFYFWSELAEYTTVKDPDLSIACCAKALLATPEEKFLGKTHTLLSNHLINRKMFPEALHEAESYRRINEENGWPVRNVYNKLIARIPQGTAEAQDNKSLYRELEQPADAFIYSDMEGHDMVLLEYRYEEKPDGKKRLMFYLYDSDNKSYRINPNAFGLDRKAKVYSCYNVKYINEEGKTRIVFVKPIEKTEVLRYRSAVVDGVNHEKKVVHVIGSGFSLVIPQEKAMRGIKVGDSVKVAVQRRVKEGKILLSCLHMKASDTPYEHILSFSGPIRLKENEHGPYGFVGDTYIPRKYLTGLYEGDEVRGTGVNDGSKFVILTFEKI